MFDLLANCNLTQHVKNPTHGHGHTLDLIITPAITTLDPVITSSHIVTSDHYPNFTSINVYPNPTHPPTTFTYRRINTIDYPKCIDDLNSSPLITNPPSCLPDLLDLFFTTLRSLLHHHAPLLTKTNKSSRTASTPWITPAILRLESARHRLERTYIASHSIFDIKLLRSSTNRYHKFIIAAKSNSTLHSSSPPHPNLELFGKSSITLYTEP